MDTDRLNRWLTLVANVGVLIGIIFLAVEIRQNSEHLALQLEFQTSQKIYDNNRDLLNSNTALVYSKAITHPENLTFDEGLLASSIVLNLLGEWEERYFIYKAGLINEADWQEHIIQNIDWTLGNDYALQTWRTSKGAFDSEFVQFVDSLVENINKTGTYDWWLDMQSQFSSSEELRD